MGAAAANPSRVKGVLGGVLHKKGKGINCRGPKALVKRRTVTNHGPTLNPRKKGVRLGQDKDGRNDGTRGVLKCTS